MMPIILKDHSWSQTKDTLHVRVPVKRIRADRTSFITSDNYIRLYYPPYYFELFLWGEVDEVNGKCTLNEKNAQVVFELPKKSTPRSGDGDGDSQFNANDGEWPALELANLDRLQKHAIRTRACEMSQKRAQAEREAALEKRQQNKQMTVQEQIRLDEEARRRISRIKTFETESFMAGVNEFEKTGGREDEDAVAAAAQMKKMSLNLQESFGDGFLFKNPDKIDGSDAGTRNTNANEDNISRDQIWSKIELAARRSEKSKDGAAATATRNTKEKEKVASPQPIAAIAPVRQGGSIKVSFTPREFPTPSRESTAHLEEEWLAKQLDARRSSGFDELNLRPEERDPSWLLEKGYDLMKTNSYLGATSAFTTGLKLAPKLPQLYVGRAEAQLALGNLIKAVEDSSQAIQLLTPKVPQNMSERLTCLICRGQAFRKLGMLKEAMEDYREALQLEPENGKIKAEYVAVQRQREELAAAGAGTGSLDED